MQNTTTKKAPYSPFGQATKARPAAAAPTFSPFVSGKPPARTADEFRIDTLVEDLKAAKATTATPDPVMVPDAEAEQFLKRLVLENDQDPNFTIRGMGTGKDGKPSIFSHVVIECPPEVRKLWEQEPDLITGLMWVEASIERRRLYVSEAGLPAGIVHVDEILDVIPDSTKEHLAGWQVVLNNGRACGVSGVIDRRFHAMMAAGFLLAPRTDQTSELGTEPGRDSLPPGSPGTPAYCRAQMSPAYLAWISAIQ